MPGHMTMFVWVLNWSPCLLLSLYIYLYRWSPVLVIEENWSLCYTSCFFSGCLLNFYMCFTGHLDSCIFTTF